YGLDGAAFPAAGNQGKCLSGSCRIWDWSLLSSDTDYRAVNAVPTGSSTAIHRWSATSQGNCTQPGAVWSSANICDLPPYTQTPAACSGASGTPGAACTSTFLRNAYEIIGDGIGNENGLCESNEACIYTPNIASYQGHGNLGCIRGPAEYGC